MIYVPCYMSVSDDGTVYVQLPDIDVGKTTEDGKQVEKLLASTPHEITTLSDVHKHAVIKSVVVYSSIWDFDARNK